MQYKCSAINSYPFDLHNENNVVGLSYTCFVSEMVGKEMELENVGFRYLGGGDVLVLVGVDGGGIEEKERCIKVPYNVLRMLSSQDQMVRVTRKPIELISATLPNFKQAKQMNVYFNSSFKIDPAIITLLTQSNFVFKNGEYYLSALWLQQCLKNYHSIRERLEWESCIMEERKGKSKTYLRIYLQANKSQNQEYYIFKKGVTKLNIKQKNMHPYNVYSTIAVPPIYKQIFQQQIYTKCTQQLSKLSQNESTIILFQTDKDIGIQYLIQSYSQSKLHMNYKMIDCEQFFSFNQFYRQLQFIANLQSSVIVVRNIAWIQELYQAEQILNFSIKHIVHKIQDKFNEILRLTHRKYILLLQYQAKLITNDMLQKSQTITINLDKPNKLYIFKTIFNSYDNQSPHRDELIQLFHDKFGWELFNKFIGNNWNQIKQKHINQIIKDMRSLIKQEQVENLISVSWDDVGGLETAKEEIIQTILLPIKHPEIFDQWIKPRTGLLFYGPPGTGKTLLGKCIAKQCKMNFISVKGPQLLNMYVGESQKNVRQVFERAIAVKPCIIFMDELDALIPKRGSGSDSHQVMDRIVAELLIQMDSASSNQVFIIGATNRPDLLDPSILRPGRFDKQIYLGITTNNQDRIKILKAQTRHLNMDKDMNFDDIIDNIPKNFTGADFYGLTSKAVMAAAERTILEYQQGIHTQTITITHQDFLSSIPSVKPSVTQSQLQRYQQLKKIYS